MVSLQRQFGAKIKSEEEENSYTAEPKLAFSLGESTLTDDRFSQNASGKGRSTNKGNLLLRNKWLGIKQRGPVLSHQLLQKD